MYIPAGSLCTAMILVKRVSFTSIVSRGFDILKNKFENCENLKNMKIQYVYLSSVCLSEKLTRKLLA